MPKKKKLLITGSGGFILGNFIRFAFREKKPYSISSLDHVRESHIAQNIYVNSDHSFHIADTRDSHTLNVIFQKEQPDIVIHGAVESSVDKSLSSSNPFTTSNVVGTQNVIDECLKYNTKLIFLSTVGVLGPLKNNDPPYLENSPIKPTNLQSATMAAAELLINSSKNLRFNILRLANNYGPWQSIDKFIPNIINKIINNEPIPVYGPGNQIRDWIHVSDSCNAISKIIDEAPDNEIYNISAKQEFMNLEVAQIICNTIGYGHELITHVNDRPGHDFRYSMNNDKIKGLDWNPQYKFRDGIQQTCQWFITNKYVLRM